MGFCVQDRKSRGLNSTIFISGIEKKDQENSIHDRKFTLNIVGIEPSPV
jgi:hypothetical protein